MKPDQQALDITKALAYTENGGKPDVKNTKAGKTGELKSIFQFEPGTWKAYSKQILGDENLPMTPENESAVTYGKVSKWLEQGHTPDQIASMWNAGSGEPDAYIGKFSDGSNSKGINKKYGVAYDVPGYVKKFNSYLNSPQDSKPIESVPMKNQSTPSVTPEISSTAPSKKKGLLSNAPLVNQGLLPTA